ncbi:MAG: hypothetical protein RMA76_04615 [Deltaproteobacteria bacterium]
MKQRPLGLLVICAMGVVGVIAQIILGAICMFGILLHAHSVTYLREGDSAIVLIAVIAGLNCWAAALVGAKLVHGLYHLRRWARTAVMVLSLVLLASVPFLFNYVTLLVGGFTLAYLALAPTVRTSFR